MQCPQCGSNNTQKSSALYEQSVRMSEGRSSGAFISSRGTVGIGSAKHVTRSSSLAAEMNAPHRRVPLRSTLAMVVGFAAMAVNVLLGGGFLLSITFALAGFVGGIYLTAPTDQELAEEKRYHSQWYCRRCGSIFFELKASSQPELVEQPNETFVSPVIRSGATHSRQSYIDRTIKPIQRARAATPRDLAGLRAIQESAEVDGAFNPETMNCDLGVISRLASLQLIQYDAGSDRFVVVGDHAVHSPPRGWWQRTFG